MSVIIQGSGGVTTNSGAVYNGIQGGTAVASTSGTSIDFTSIPSWAKRVTVILNNVSVSGTSIPQIQIGAGSVTTSGYVAASSLIFAGATTTTATTGFIVYSNQAAANLNGHMIITLISGNIWVASGYFGNSSTTANTTLSGGNVTLGGTLDRVRITTVNGTDTFDAGSINILYE
jgi:hypothetical protein